MLDGSGSIQQANQAFCRMVSYPLERVLGRSFFDFIDREARGHFGIDKTGSNYIHADPACRYFDREGRPA